MGKRLFTSESLHRRTSGQNATRFDAILMHVGTGSNELWHVRHAITTGLVMVMGRLNEMGYGYSEDRT